MTLWITNQYAQLLGGTHKKDLLDIGIGVKKLLVDLLLPSIFNSVSTIFVAFDRSPVHSRL